MKRHDESLLACSPSLSLSLFWKYIHRSFLAWRWDLMLLSEPVISLFTVCTGELFPFHKRYQSVSACYNSSCFIFCLLKKPTKSWCTLLPFLWFFFPWVLHADRKALFRVPTYLKKLFGFYPFFHFKLWWKSRFLKNYNL